MSHLSIIIVTLALGIVNCYGQPYSKNWENVNYADDSGSTMVHDAPDSPESILIGAPIQENDDLCALANPISYIDPNDPPFLILHGDADPLVPHCQSEMLFHGLQKAGVSSQLVLVSQAGHGPGLFKEEYFRMMTDFFLRESGVGE